MEDAFYYENYSYNLMHSFVLDSFNIKPQEIIASIDKAILNDFLSELNTNSIKFKKAIEEYKKLKLPSLEKKIYCEKYCL